MESLPSPAVAPPVPAVAPPVPKAESAPPTPAAPRPVDPAPQIRSVIADYAAAIESKSLAGLQRVYPAMTPIQQRGWEQFFQLVRDVRARLSVAGLSVTSGTAEAQITGTYDYLNTSTGRAESKPVSFRASFTQEAGRWRISQVR
jgi:hypothetical protein